MSKPKNQALHDINPEPLIQQRGERRVHAMLTRVLVEKDSMPNAQPVAKTATGMSAFSIWMKDTLRYRYAALPSHSVPAEQHCCAVSVFQ